MLSSASHRTGQFRTRSAIRISTVCVVDPNADDYQGWSAAVEANGAQLQIFASAQEALRYSRDHDADLWVVNATLPDLSGFELCGMLQAKSKPAPVYVVADEYSPAAERAAWQSRATLFGCKPAQATLLAAWLESRRPSACLVSLELAAS